MAACHSSAFAGIGRAWSNVEFNALVDSPLVFVTGDARGFALGRVIADEAELLTLATAPAHQRSGLARTCLAAFEREAALRGARVAFLEVAEDNLPARALYDGAGYTEAARRTAYYVRQNGETSDALVLRKSLAAQGGDASSGVV